MADSPFSSAAAASVGRPTPVELGYGAALDAHIACPGSAIDPQCVAARREIVEDQHTEVVVAGAPTKDSLVAPAAVVATGADLDLVADHLRISVHNQRPDPIAKLEYHVLEA